MNNSANRGFGSDLYKNLSKVRANGKDGIYFPVKANGKDGVVIGDPKLKIMGESPKKTAQEAKKPGLVARLLGKLKGKS